MRVSGFRGFRGAVDGEEEEPRPRRAASAAPSARPDATAAATETAGASNARDTDAVSSKTFVSFAKTFVSFAVEPGEKSRFANAANSTLSAKSATTSASLATVTAMTCWQNGPRASISRSTAMALAGERAIASVPSSDPTSATCAVPSSLRNATRGPTTRNARNTKPKLKTETHAVITSVGRGWRRRSANCSSAPAAMPITARHIASVAARRAACVSPSTASALGPSAAPVSRYPLMRGRRRRWNARPASDATSRTATARAAVPGSTPGGDHIARTPARRTGGARQQCQSTKKRCRGEERPWREARKTGKTAGRVGARTTSAVCARDEKKQREKNTSIYGRNMGL